MPAESSRRFVVVGNNPLAYRLANELASRSDVNLTVLMRSTTQEMGPQITQLPVQIVEHEDLDDESLRAAGVAKARALALLDQDDAGNLHLALRAQELNPSLRIVIRMFNMSLGHRVRMLLSDTVVLSDSAMAAPTFVAAALGELAPNYVRLPGRTLYMARRGEVPNQRVVCGLADTTGEVSELLPADQSTANLVLATADGTLRQARSGLQPRRWLDPRGWLSAIGHAIRTNRLVQIGLGVFVLLALGVVFFARVGGFGWSAAIYETLLDAAGAAQPDLKLSTPNKIVQTAITLAGISFIPVVTAAVVDRLVTPRLAQGRPMTGHVIVVGLGNVGSRVIRQLHDLGVPILCIDKDVNARGVPFAREKRLPLLIADGAREDVLRAASVRTCRALLALTTDDMVNLEAGLQGRALREDLRVVLRLFDDDLAERVERIFGINVSRSVSRVSAPAFAAAMLERQWIGTLPIGRRILTVAEVPVAPNARLIGQPISAVHEAGKARVIAVQHRGESRLDWTPRADYRLFPHDRLILLATRAGLGRVIDQAS